MTTATPPLPFSVQNLGSEPVNTSRPGRKPVDNPFIALLTDAWKNRKDGAGVSDTLQIIVPNEGTVSKKTGRHANVTTYIGQIRAAAYSLEIGISVTDFRCDPKGKEKENGSMTAIRFRGKTLTKRTRKSVVTNSVDVDDSLAENATA